MAAHLMSTVAISVISVPVVEVEGMQKLLGQLLVSALGIVAKVQQVGVRISVWAIMVVLGAVHSTATVTVRRLHQLRHLFMAAVPNRSYRSAGCAVAAGYLLIPQEAKALCHPTAETLAQAKETQAVRDW